MKRVAVFVLFLSGSLVLLNGCASHNELSTETSSAAVPGEKVSGEGITPGAGPSGASANVRW
jgi:hypothetical protein